MKIASVTPIPGEDPRVEFGFTNGKKLVCRYSELPEEMKVYSALFGFSRAVRNEFASSKELNLSIDDCEKLARNRWEEICRGNWSTGTRGRIPALVEFFMEAFEKSEDEAREVVGKLDAKNRKSLENGKDFLTWKLSKIEGSDEGEESLDIEKLFAKK